MDTEKQCQHYSFYLRFPFCKVFDDCVKRYGRTQKAIEETLRICKDRNLLKEYLEKRETEVKGIMLTLFNQERVTELYGMEMREEGRAEGIVDTYTTLVRDDLISKETAAKKLGISVDEFEKKMAACE